MVENMLAAEDNSSRGTSPRFKVTSEVGVHKRGKSSAIILEGIGVYQLRFVPQVADAPVESLNRSTCRAGKIPTKFFRREGEIRAIDGQVIDSGAECSVHRCQVASEVSGSIIEPLGRLDRLGAQPLLFKLLVLGDSGHQVLNSVLPGGTIK